MDSPGIIQNALSCSGFTCINVSHNSNISGFFQGEFSAHAFLLSKDIKSGFLSLALIIIIAE
jgi:hypothetical protein